MKLEKLKSIEIKAIEVPTKIPVPPFANSDKVSDRIFGAVCRINPELPCMENEKFLQNVFTCFESAGGNKPKTVDLVSYMKTDSTVQKWRKWYAEEKERKAEFNKLHKDERKKDLEDRKQKYGTVIVNGQPDTFAAGGYTLEAEGIFFGRGESPANGFWKAATDPKDVIVNTNSKNLPVLLEIQPDNSRIEKQFNWNITWEPDFHGAAKYVINVGVPNKDGQITKVVKTSYKNFGLASSRQEGQEKKYAAGTVLGKAYDRIKEQLDQDFKKLNIDELGTTIAVFLLFEKGIRIGQKTTTENGTKGLLSLIWNKDVKRVGNKIKFDFYGKDSVRDTSSIETDYVEKIEQHWSKFKQIKTDKALIEDYVSKIEPALNGIFTPKLARTAVACSVAQKALDEMIEKYKITKESNITLKKLVFTEATMLVAKRLNHQRGVNKIVEEKRKIRFEEQNSKLSERKQKTQETIEKKRSLILKFKEAGNTEKVKKLKEEINKAKEKIQLAEKNLESKERNQNFANSTAINSYIDPSIVIQFCKDYELPVNKVYTKARLKQLGLDQE